MNKFVFTKRAIDALPIPDKGRAYHYDEKQTGLAVAVTSTGAKSFVVYRKVRGIPKRVLLGRHPDMTPELARKAALKVLHEIAGGADPNAEKKAARIQGLTLKQAFDEYFHSTRGAALSKLTRRDYERCVNVQLKDWQNKPVIAISGEMVVSKHRELGKRSPAQANMAMRILRAVFEFTAAKQRAGGESLIHENPVRLLSQLRLWYRVDRRRTVITASQIKPWFQAVHAIRDEDGPAAGSIRDVLLLMLLTGLRSTEARTLRWEHVNLKERTLTIPKTKNHRPHTLPLTDFLFELLQRRKLEATGSPFVFPGEDGENYLVEPRKTMQKIVDASGVEFCLHDLRRTFATITESLDVPHYALKALLNHSAGNDVTSGYTVLTTERLRAPMQKVTDHILKLAGAKTSAEVVELRPQGAAMS